MQGRELIARTEARRASRSDYNKWVSDGANKKALAKLAGNARSAARKISGETTGDDDDDDGRSVGDELEDLESVDYGYGEEFGRPRRGINKKVTTQAILSRHSCCMRVGCPRRRI